MEIIVERSALAIYTSRWYEYAYWCTPPSIILLLIIAGFDITHTPFLLSGFTLVVVSALLIRATPLVIAAVKPGGFCRVMLVEEKKITLSLEKEYMVDTRDITSMHLRAANIWLFNLLIVTFFNRDGLKMRITSSITHPKLISALHNLRKQIMRQSAY